MTYRSWFEAHSLKHAAIVSKLLKAGFSENAIIDYFEFESMCKNEPGFCPLYATHTKCHDMEHLNCYFCACPHFRFDDAGLFEAEGIVHYSLCAIDAPKGSLAIFGSSAHQDCSACTLPHQRSVIASHFDTEWQRIMAACLPPAQIPEPHAKTEKEEDF